MLQEELKEDGLAETFHPEGVLLIDALTFSSLAASGLRTLAGVDPPLTLCRGLRLEVGLVFVRNLVKEAVTVN